MTANSGSGNAGSSEQAARVAQSFVALADSLMDDVDVADVLRRLATHCIDLLKVSAAGILLLDRDNGPAMVATSAKASHLLEELPLDSRADDCLDVLRGLRMAVTTETGELARRWPRFAEALEEAGYATVCALPMRLREQSIGSLVLFLAETDPLSELDLRVGQALADVVTIGIVQNRTMERAATLADQLQHALDTRIAVEQAKGVLAEHGGVGMGVAFEALRSYARNHRVKLSTVARLVVDRELDPEAVISRERPPGQEAH